MLRIVVLAGGKGVEATSQAIDGRIQIQIIVVREDDVEVPVEEAGSEFVEVLGDEGEANEVALSALGGRVSKSWPKRWGGGAFTWEKISR